MDTGWIQDDFGKNKSKPHAGYAQILTVLTHTLPKNITMFLKQHRHVFLKMYCYARENFNGNFSYKTLTVKLVVQT